MPTKKRCNWDSDNHQWLTAEHIHGCKDGGCPGCKPCEKDHCGMRGRCDRHVNHDAGIITCARCIGGVRTTITKIVDAYEHDLHEEAERLGVTSEAFMLIGPALAPEIVHLAKLEDNPLEIDPDHHPLRVLGDWDMTVRTEYQMPTTIRRTVPRSADYLKDMLATDFPHRADFDRFADELKDCLTHIEAVLHDSRSREVGARCPACGTNAPRLVRRYAETDGEHVIGCGDVDCTGGCVELDDTWHCPADAAHWWTMTDYRLRVDATFVETADWLPDSEASNRTDVPRATIRSWALRGHVKKRTVAGRIVYRIADILTRKEAS